MAVAATHSPLVVRELRQLVYQIPFRIMAPLKFMYSEKATKFCEISTILLSYVVPVKSNEEISQNFVAFSEYMNFNGLISIFNMMSSLVFSPDFWFYNSILTIIQLIHYFGKENYKSTQIETLQSAEKKSHCQLLVLRAKKLPLPRFVQKAPWVRLLVLARLFSQNYIASVLQSRNLSN